MRYHLRTSVLVVVCLFVAACGLLGRLADRQNRHRRYTQALRSLPERATRAEIYRALPPQTLPAPPSFYRIMGVGSMPTEYYPLDADYQVAVPFLHARSRFICERHMAHFDSATPYLLTRNVQSYET